MSEKVPVIVKKLAPRTARNEKVITVILGDINPDILKDFHCLSCGRIVFNYYSETRIVIVGEMQEVLRPIDVMCSRCKTMYRIS